MLKCSVENAIGSEACACRFLAKLLVHYPKGPSINIMSTLGLKIGNYKHGLGQVFSLFEALDVRVLTAV